MRQIVFGKNMKKEETERIKEKEKSHQNDRSHLLLYKMKKKKIKTKVNRSWFGRFYRRFGGSLAKCG